MIVDFRDDWLRAFFVEEIPSRKVPADIQSRLFRKLQMIDDAIADQAARKLTKEGKGKMFCLAGVGGRVPGIMKSTQAADRVLAIDGCALDCAKNCLEQAGFKKFEFVRLTDLGMEKGKTPVTEQSIRKVAEAGAAKLAAV